MDDSQFKFILYTILLTLIIPQAITLCGIYRRVSADDKICGVNEVNSGGECACETCYVKDESGKCNKCSPNCSATYDSEGKIICTKTTFDQKQKNVDNIVEMKQTKERDLFKITNNSLGAM